MPAAETGAFEKQTYFRDAVRVRRWDDRAKIADLKVPDLAAYRTLIDQTRQP
jgi:predicted HD phosphohydrolase